MKGSLIVTLGDYSIISAWHFLGAVGGLARFHERGILSTMRRDDDEGPGRGRCSRKSWVSPNKRQITVWKTITGLFLQILRRSSFLTEISSLGSQLYSSEASCTCCALCSQFTNRWAFNHTRFFNLIFRSLWTRLHGLRWGSNRQSKRANETAQCQT